MNKIAIFIDVQNIYYTSKQAFGRPFDYRRLWQIIAQEGEIIAANAYAIARNDDGQKRFQDALRALGYTIKLKPFIQRSDGTAKGDWDVGITIDMLDMASSIDSIVLLSGDGDFSLLLEKIKKDHRCHSHVYGVRSLTAKALIDSCDQFTAIDQNLLL
jgi:uncharacterized LabA/DUF88 family protein